MVQSVNSAGIQGRDIQRVDENDEIISEIDQMRVGLNVIVYRYNYTLIRQFMPDINKIMSLKYHKTSRKCFVITIFDL